MIQERKKRKRKNNIIPVLWKYYMNTEAHKNFVKI